VGIVGKGECIGGVLVPSEDFERKKKKKKKKKKNCVFIPAD
jgi:hypothetical protein